MNMENRRVLLTGAYAILRNELTAVGLCEADGRPVKRNRLDQSKLDSVDIEMQELYVRLADLVYIDDRWNARLERFNAALRRLPDNHGNKASVALQIVSIALDGFPGPQAVMLRSKSLRILDNMIEAVLSEDPKLPVYSYRIADNLARLVEGRPALDNELRDKRMKRIFR